MLKESENSRHITLDKLNLYIVKNQPMHSGLIK